LIKVIIVEDDPMVREINKEFLGKIDGFNVIYECSRIKEAQEFLLENSVDLILLDVFLPNGNGIDLLKWVRKNDINCDAILITAEKGVQSVDESFRYGAVDYLVKPFSKDRFNEALIKYKNRHDKMSSLVDLKQEHIDKYIVNSENSNVSKKETVKGLSLVTYNEIWRTINNNPAKEVTADSLADDVGLARVTVRRYLEYMVEEGKMELTLEYGKVGRPNNYYRLKK
jgi:two-component system, CitB family, response regulator